MSEIQLKFTMASNLGFPPVFVAEDEDLEIFHPDAVSGVALNPGVGAQLEFGD
jgi:hypothetical protein